MFKSNLLSTKESQKIKGGESTKQGPYGQCFYYSSGTYSGWVRDASNKNGTRKRCDEK